MNLTVDIFMLLVPDAPEEFMVEEITSTTVRVTWMEPLDSNGILLGYELSIRNVTEYLPPTNNTFEPRRDDVSYDITDLHPFADYSLVLRARTIVGLGSETTRPVQTRQDGMQFQWNLQVISRHLSVHCSYNYLMCCPTQ